MSNSPASSSCSSAEGSWKGSSPETHLSGHTPTSSGGYEYVSGAASSYAYLQQSATGRGYVSPYPLLPTSSAQARPALTSTRDMSLQQRPSPSARHSHDPTPQDLDPAQKQVLIEALNQRRINTLTELRRVERIFADLGSADVNQPMTSAWVHYVNSNSLLTELRSLTRNYPFSSACLDEAKRRVHQDPASNRSWNYCWLVLTKIHSDGLIQPYARALAPRPEMWGGRTPSSEAVVKLTEAFVREWSAAVTQLLRHWETAPTR